MRICLLLVFACGAASASVVAAGESAAKPNVVILLADDLGWADVSYHADRADTPNIDRLVSDGIELDRFYVAPMCSPTRAGLMTGRYPIRFGLARAVIPPHRKFGLDIEERTLPEALAAAGYVHRGVFGKWHLGHNDVKWHPLRQGFTKFEGHYNGAIDYFALSREGERDWHEDYEPSRKQGYSTDLIADAAVNFIARAAPHDAPYFCYVPFNAPHSPFQAKREDLERYADMGGNPDAVDGPELKGKSRAKIDDATRRLALKAMIWRMDQSVGRILQAIDESGERDNTQVWFMSDNGGIGAVSDNNLPLRGNKLSVFEGGIRVPACVRWPIAWDGGRKLSQPMGYVDVMPTVLATAGVPWGQGVVPGRPFDGADLTGVLNGAVTELLERDWYSYHGQQGEMNELLAVSTPEWKLIVLGPKLTKAGLSDRHTIHLFEIAKDPFEENDLAAERSDIVDQLLPKLITHRALQPKDGNPAYDEGREGFTPPKAWRIER